MICQKCGMESETGLKDGICPDCQLAGVPAAITESVKRSVPVGLAPRVPVEMTQQGVMLKSLDDLARFSQMIADSGLAPKGMERPQAIALAIQCGMELGFSPMRALSAVYVVNGRPALYGQAALARIRSSGACKSLETGVTGQGEERVGFVRSQRVGSSQTIERTFTVADAKLMGLWKKTGPWVTDPDSMLVWRAVARTAKLDWSDVLMGLELAEVAVDIPLQRHEPEPSGPDPLLEEA